MKNIDLINSNLFAVLDRTINLYLRADITSNNATLNITYGDGKNKVLQFFSGNIFQVN